jgi:hypothetical protein
MVVTDMTSMPRLLNARESTFEPRDGFRRQAVILLIAEIFRSE